MLSVRVQDWEDRPSRWLRYTCPVRGERKVDLYTFVGLHWLVQGWMALFPVVDLHVRYELIRYGLCWFMRDQPTVRLAPMPLNVPIRLVWFICCWIRAPFPRAWRDE